MAKKENIVDLKGGLTTGLDFGKAKEVMPAPVVPAEEPAAPAETAVPSQNAQDVQNVQNVPVAAPVVKEPKKSSPVSKSLNELYEAKRQAEVEPRTVRIQAVVTPTIATKLDELVASNQIKSRNDLINFLLEGYLGNMK